MYKLEAEKGLIQAGVRNASSVLDIITQARLDLKKTYKALEALRTFV